MFPILSNFKTNLFRIVAEYKWGNGLTHGPKHQDNHAQYLKYPKHPCSVS